LGCAKKLDAIQETVSNLISSTESDLDLDAVSKASADLNNMGSSSCSIAISALIQSDLYKILQLIKPLLIEEQKVGFNTRSQFFYMLTPSKIEEIPEIGKDTKNQPSP
jgi:hypothetical protein